MLTLITVCFNNPQELAKTIDSVSLQTVHPDNYLIVDSSASYVVPEMMRLAESVNAKYVWVPPEGVYPAMRHSLSLVDDEHWVWWLNSSDWLAGKRSIEVAKEAIDCAESSGGNHWIVGELLRNRPVTPSVHKVGTSGEEFLRLLQSGQTGFPHPSTIFRAGALKKVNAYTGPYQIASDYATALRFGREYGQPSLISNSLSVHDPVGLTSENPLRNLLEKSLARLKEGSASLKLAEVWRLPASVSRGVVNRFLGEKSVTPENNRLAEFPLAGNESFDRTSTKGRFLNFRSLPSDAPTILCITDPSSNGRIARSISFFEGANRQPLVVFPGSSSTTAENFLPLRGLFGSSNLGTSLGRLFTRILLWLGFLLRINSQKSAVFAADMVLGANAVHWRISELSGPVLVEDALLLPSALRLKPRRRVVFDARDLSHRLFENKWLWRMTFGKALTQLLANSLPLCDAIITVSDGLADQMLKDFGVRAEVVRSVTSAGNYSPSAIQQRPLDIVYMGRADTNRGLDKLVGAARDLVGHMTVHLYLVGHQRDIRRLRRRAAGLANVVFHEPVAFDSIVPTLSNFDIGYAALGHETVNIKLSLPNKFFEYVSAGIPAVVSGGSEMARVLERFSLGVAIDDSSPTTIAAALGSLTHQKVEDFHAGVLEAQKFFNWEEESEKFGKIFDLEVPGSF